MVEPGRMEQRTSVLRRAFEAVGWLVLALAVFASPRITAQPIAFTVERASEWEALFDRTSGWTGSDGIYSIPLSSDESAGGYLETPTLFGFGDTFIGEVGPNGERLGGWSLVNNTLAYMPPGEPDPDTVDFYWSLDGFGNPAAAFVPDTPQSSPGDWYWFGDWVIVGERLYNFPLRMVPGFLEIGGVSLLELPLDSPQPLPNQRQADTPLYVPPQDGRDALVFGGGILDNRREAGAPRPDGFLYVYGIENSLIKRLLVARVAPEDLTDFTAWRYWDGGAWVSELTEAVAITSGLSQEFSVSPLPDGRYVVVYKPWGSYVSLRIGDTPVGPFGDQIDIWLTPEDQFDPDVFTYNAKAHPHLSQPGELIISYNVNSLEFADNLEHADIYRPRFIRVRFE